MAGRTTRRRATAGGLLGLGVALAALFVGCALVTAAVGAVMGHDVGAAEAMGQLRSVLRSYAYEGTSPSVVLDRMDRLVQGFEMAEVATAIYRRLIHDHRGGLFLFSTPDTCLR